MGSFGRDLTTVPNIMSLARLAAAPTLAFFWFGLDMKGVALAIGTAAGITDLFDGIVARKLNQVTSLGALIDQLGDLIFESCCLLLGVLTGELWSGFLVLYLFREFTVTVMRTYVATRGGALPSSTLGKAKSSFLQYAFFIFFLGAILLEPGYVSDSHNIAGVSPGRVLLWTSTASLSVGILIGYISGWQYLKAFIRFYGEDAPGPK